MLSFVFNNSTLLVHLFFFILTFVKALEKIGTIAKHMAKSGLKVKQNPQLKKRELTGGRIALYLEYYYGRTQEPRLDKNGQPMYYPSGTKMEGKPMYIVKHERKKEELRLYIMDKPRTPEEREQNRETLILAEKIRQEREQERLNDVMGYRVNTHKNDNIITFFDTYLEDYTKKDKRNVALAINRFKTFLREYRQRKKEPSLLMTARVSIMVTSYN